MNSVQHTGAEGQCGAGPKPIDAPRFNIEDPESVQAALEYLDQEGYVVFGNILSEVESEHAMNLLWTWLENAGEQTIKRNDWKTWNNRWPGHVSNGVIAQHGIGQTDFLWYVRTQPKVRRAFEHVWGTEELLCSFDGCGIFRPHAEMSEWRTSGGWHHIDQGAHKKGKHCIQGQIALADQTPETGGLVVVPNSVQYHDRITDTFEDTATGKDFIVLTGPKTSFLPLDTSRLVCCKKGDLILWDSRTIHCNTPNITQPAAHPMNKLLRVVCYVCMTPKSLANEEVLKLRQNAYECMNTTNHWPHEFCLSADATHEQPVRRLDNAQLNVRELVLGFRASPQERAKSQDE